MKRFGVPKISLVVWGDWHTIIGVREYRDALIDQKPDDEEDAEYGQYRIPCEDTPALMQAYLAFSDKGVRCAVQIIFDSEDRAVRVFATTGNGWGKDEPHCDVQVNEPTSAMMSAIKTAVDILKEAVK